MKRSEMVKKIAELIRVNPSSEVDNSHLVAELVLYFQEKAGMLPPYNPTSLDHGSIQDCVWDAEVEMSQEEYDQCCGGGCHE